MHSVRRAFRLCRRASDWRLLLGAAIAQAVTACALRATSLRTVRTLAARCRPFLRVMLNGPDERVIRAVEATGRRLGGMSTCLVRAIVVETRLTAPGRRLRLTIGVKRAAAGGLNSHAWVTDGQRILTGGPADPDLLPIIAWESAA